MNLHSAPLFPQPRAFRIDGQVPCRRLPLQRYRLTELGIVRTDRAPLLWPPGRAALLAAVCGSAVPYGAAIGVAPGTNGGLELALPGAP